MTTTVKIIRVALSVIGDKPAKLARYDTDKSDKCKVKTTVSVVFVELETRNREKLVLVNWRQTVVRLVLIVTIEV